MENLNRSAFIGAGALLAAAAASACASSAPEIGGVESAAQFNDKAFAAKVSRPADIRLVVDGALMYPPLLGAIMNALNGYQFGFAIPANRIAITAVMHGSGNLLLYNNNMWARYDLGTLFDVRDPNNNVVATNIFAPPGSTFTSTDDPHGSYHQAFVGVLQQRGVVFCLCNTALYEQAQTIAGSAKSGGQSVQQIADDLRSNVVPGAILVPSGVATVGLLQYRYRYAYITEVTG